MYRIPPQSTYALIKTVAYEEISPKILLSKTLFVVEYFSRHNLP